MTALAFQGRTVQARECDGRMAWLATDVAQACGANPQAAKTLISRHRDDFVEGVDFRLDVPDRTGFSVDLTLNPRGDKGGRPALWLFESGVHLFCMLSRAPLAKAFRRWLASEVLPTLARTGTYNWSVLAAACAQVWPELKWEHREYRGAFGSRDWHTVVSITHTPDVLTIHLFPPTPKQMHDGWFFSGTCTIPLDAAPKELPRRLREARTLWKRL